MILPITRGFNHGFDLIPEVFPSKKSSRLMYKYVDDSTFGVRDRVRVRVRVEVRVKARVSAPQATTQTTSCTLFAAFSCTLQISLRKLSPDRPSKCSSPA
jgi:hypothetical protein